VTVETLEREALVPQRQPVWRRFLAAGYNLLRDALIGLGMTERCGFCGANLEFVADQPMEQGVAWGYLYSVPVRGYWRCLHCGDALAKTYYPFLYWDL